MVIVGINTLYIEYNINIYLLIKIIYLITKNNFYLYRYNASPL